MVFFKSYLFTNFLSFYLSVIRREVLESFIITIFISLSYNFIDFRNTCWGQFIIGVIYSTTIICLIIMEWASYHYTMTFLSLKMIFKMKSVLYDINTEMLAFLWFHF